MGSVHVEVYVSNPATPDASEKVKLLVDTDELLSVLPASLLERLGIHRIGRRRRRVSGEVVTCDVGSVTMHYDGAVGGVAAIFGDEDGPVIMGATALLTMGLEVDPEAGRLKHVEILMY